MTMPITIKKSRRAVSAVGVMVWFDSVEEDVLVDGQGGGKIRVEPGALDGKQDKPNQQKTDQEAMAIMN